MPLHTRAADRSDEFVTGVDESTTQLDESARRDAIPDTIARRSQLCGAPNGRGARGMSIAHSTFITKKISGTRAAGAGIENTFDIPVVVPEYVRPPSNMSASTSASASRAHEFQLPAVAKGKNT